MKIEDLHDVKVDVRIEFGRTRMTVREILALKEGSTIRLDKYGRAPVDIFVNNILVAEGEILILNKRFCVRVTEVFDAGNRALVTRRLQGDDA